MPITTDSSLRLGNRREGERVTQEEINKAINECKWKSDFDVCRGMCLPCHRVIEKGQCNTLIELFRKGKESK